VRRQEAWDTVAVPLGAIRVELKAGTSSAETAPGTVIFDKLKVSRGGTDQTVLLWEDFAGTSLDTATWAIAVQSGHQDASIPVVQDQSRLTIGPLLEGTSGSHYNGVLSQTPFDLTGAAVSVEAVTTPSDLTTADMMFTLTVDNPHHSLDHAPLARGWADLPGAGLPAVRAEDAGAREGGGGAGR
jgi:hypothetical protein